MNCATARDTLLSADAPPAADVAAHLQDCPACAALARDLAALEERWRARPLPANAETSKAAFLARVAHLANPPAPAPQPAPAPRRRREFLGWAAALILLIGTGAAVLVFGPGRDAEAHPDVIEQLVDWNIDLSEAAPAERERIYHERRGALQKSLGTAKLDADDRKLAERLLDNGGWLAGHEDPVEELDRFTGVADTLLERLEAAGTDPAKADRLARQFRKVNERAIGRNVEKVRAAKITDPQKKKLVNRLLKKDAERAEQLMDLIEKSPDLTKKELRQALDLTAKRQRHKKI
jgi:hypothetical protein